MYYTFNDSERALKTIAKHDFKINAILIALHNERYT